MVGALTYRGAPTHKLFFFFLFFFSFLAGPRMTTVAGLMTPDPGLHALHGPCTFCHRNVLSRHTVILTPAWRLQRTAVDAIPRLPGLALSLNGRAASSSRPSRVRENLSRANPLPLLTLHRQRSRPHPVQDLRWMSRRHWPRLSVMSSVLWILESQANFRFVQPLTLSAHKMSVNHRSCQTLRRIYSSLRSNSSATANLGANSSAVPDATVVPSI
jgi:hypothetical protein